MKKESKKPSKALKLKKETVRDLPKKAAETVKGGRKAATCSATFAPPYVPVCP